MARVTLTDGAYREGGSVERYDPYKLERDEVGRIWIPGEHFGWIENVHALRAPVFADDGKPLMTTKWGREVYETDSISRPICLGDPAIIADKNLDVKHCPACAGVQKMLDDGLSDALDLRPQRRFALPVLRYFLLSKRDETKLQSPPGAKIYVWALSQGTYNKLDGTRGQMAELLEIPREKVKLQMTDLAMHCDSGQFQTFDKIWPLRAAWRRSEAVKGVLEPLWSNEENRPSDAQMRAACGQEPNLDFMRRDIEEAHQRWHRAVHYSPGSGRPDPTGNGALSGQSADEALDSLLADGPADQQAPESHPGGLAEFGADDDLFGAPASSAAPAAATSSADDSIFGGPAETPASSAPPAAQSGDDDLFGTPDASPAPAAANGEGKKPVGSFDEIAFD